MGSPHRENRVRDVVARSYAVVLVAFAVVVSISLGMGLLSIAHFDPMRARYSDATGGVSRMHQGLLDQQTGLRGYLLTRDRQFLQPYTDGQQAYFEGAATTARAIEHDQELRTRLFAVTDAAGRWHRDWATEALARDDMPAAAADNAAFQRAGKALFDVYRTEHARLRTLVDDRAAQTRAAQRRLFLAGMTAQCVTWLALVLAAVRRRKRIHQVLVAPIAELAATVDRFEHGDLATRPVIGGVVELQDLGRGLVRLANALSEEQRAAGERETAAVERAQRNRQLLDNAREFASDLDLGHLVGAIATSMRRLADAEATEIWLTSEADSTLLEHPFSTSNTPSCTSSRVGTGHVGTAAQLARPTWGVCAETGRPVIALPMISAGRCLGVVELRAGPDGIDPELLEPLEALVSHAATAIEAAKLHRQVEHLSRHDGLTGLLNRRSLDAALAHETAIAARTGTPLTLVMLDVDHFKRFNDTFGHPDGDALLQQLAAELRRRIRSTDSAYRFGGEEFVLLLRATTAADAQPMIEELRLRLAQSFIDSGITASFGVADARGAGANAVTLLGAADRALYAAKRSGRNRVVVAVDGQVSAGSA